MILPFGRLNISGPDTKAYTTCHYHSNRHYTTASNQLSKCNHTNTRLRLAKHQIWKQSYHNWICPRSLATHMQPLGTDAQRITAALCGITRRTYSITLVQFQRASSRVTLHPNVHATNPVYIDLNSARTPCSVSHDLEQRASHLISSHRTCLHFIDITTPRNLCTPIASATTTTSTHPHPSMSRYGVQASNTRTQQDRHRRQGHQPGT